MKNWKYIGCILLGLLICFFYCKYCCPPNAKEVTSQCDINAICTDTFIVKSDKLNNGRPDTIFQRYYCSQIVVSGVTPNNENGLDSLLQNGFSVLRSCACDNITILGRDTPLNLEERVSVSNGEIVDESGGLGTGINYLLEFPTPLQFKFEENGGEKNPPQNNNKRKVKVAVIDSGFDFMHEALYAYKWINPTESNGNLNLDKDGNCYNFDKFGYDFADDSPIIHDDNGHGTHVAGIISRNFGGTLNVELMNLKIFGKEGADLFNLACALHYAEDKKADIINLSLGYYAPDLSLFLDKLFKKIEASKILVVTSAGNEGYDNDLIMDAGKQIFHFPSSFNQKYPKNILAVAATQGANSNSLWSDSNYGTEHVDVATNGVNVLSAYIDPMDMQSGPPYIRLNGTSMAAANITHMAVEKLCNNAGMEPLDAKVSIESNATNPTNVKTKYGEVQ